MIQRAKVSDEMGSRVIKQFSTSKGGIKKFVQNLSSRSSNAHSMENEDAHMVLFSVTRTHKSRCFPFYSVEKVIFVFLQ